MSGEKRTLSGEKRTCPGKRGRLVTLSKAQSAASILISRCHANATCLHANESYAGKCIMGYTELLATFKGQHQSVGIYWCNNLFWTKRVTGLDRLDLCQWIKTVFVGMLSLCGLRWGFLREWPRFCYCLFFFAGGLTKALIVPAVVIVSWNGLHQSNHKNLSFQRYVASVPSSKKHHCK